jgi:Flp pilus assembly protein TadG
MIPSALAGHRAGRSNRTGADMLGSDSGAAAVEFAIVGPIFLILLVGVMAWGNYFWLSHSLQQVANDAARAALAGVDAAERKSLAAAVLAEEIGDYASLTPKAASVQVQDVANRVTVTISYDASSSPFWAFSTLVPMPSSLIKRQASVRLGGY